MTFQTEKYLVIQMEAGAAYDAALAALAERGIEPPLSDGLPARSEFSASPQERCIVVNISDAGTVDMSVWFEAIATALRSREVPFEEKFYAETNIIFPPEEPNERTRRSRRPSLRDDLNKAIGQDGSIVYRTKTGCKSAPKRLIHFCR